MCSVFSLLHSTALWCRTLHTILLPLSLFFFSIYQSASSERCWYTCSQYRVVRPPVRLRLCSSVNCKYVLYYIIVDAFVSYHTRRVPLGLRNETPLKLLMSNYRLHPVLFLYLSHQLHLAAIVLFGVYFFIHSTFQFCYAAVFLMKSCISKLFVQFWPKGRVLSLHENFDMIIVIRRTLKW